MHLLIMSSQWLYDYYLCVFRCVISGHKQESAPPSYLYRSATGTMELKNDFHWTHKIQVEIKETQSLKSKNKFQLPTNYKIHNDTIFCWIFTLKDLKRYLRENRSEPIRFHYTCVMCWFFFFGMWILLYL